MCVHASFDYPGVGTTRCLNDVECDVRTVLSNDWYTGQRPRGCTYSMSLPRIGTWLSTDHRLTMPCCLMHPREIHREIKDVTDQASERSPDKTRWQSLSQHVQLQHLGTPPVARLFPSLRTVHSQWGIFKRLPGGKEQKALLSSMDQCIRFSARACVPTHLCLGAENPFAIATNACLLWKSSNGCVNQRLGPNNSNNNISSQRPKRSNAIAKCHPLGSVQLYYRGLLPSLPTK